MTLIELRIIAARMGCKIDDDSFDGSPGFWLLNAETGEGVWEDDNFSTSLSEVEGKLQSLAAERGLTWEGYKLLTSLPLTGWDLEQALDVVWAALERVELTEDEQDHLNTAMAWITEATEECPG